MLLLSGYQLTDLQCSPRPVQQPGPPLLIAGSGRRVLTLAAREADSIGVAFSTGGSQLHIANGSAAATTERVGWIKEAAGERFATLELNTIVFHVVVTDNRRGVAKELAGGWGCTADELLDTINVLIGSIEQIVEQLQMWRERFGISYIVPVGTEHMDALAPVVRRLAGT